MWPNQQCQSTEGGCPGVLRFPVKITKSSTYFLSIAQHDNNTTGKNTRSSRLFVTDFPDQFKIHCLFRIFQVGTGQPPWLQISIMLHGTVNVNQGISTPENKCGTNVVHAVNSSIAKSPLLSFNDQTSALPQYHSCTVCVFSVCQLPSWRIKFILSPRLLLSLLFLNSGHLQQIVNWPLLENDKSLIS